MLVLLSVGPASAINKCIGNNGAVTFQNKACPEPGETDIPGADSHNSLENTDLRIVDIKVSRKKKFSISIPDHWQYSIETNSNAAQTLNAVDAYGEAVRLVMTFLPERGKSLLNGVIKTIEGRHIKKQKVDSKELTQVFSDSVGRVLIYRDEKQADNEFSYLATGAVIIDGVLITISISTNNLNSDNYTKAMAAIQTIVN